MNAAQWSLIKHFKPYEFDSPDSPGSGGAMEMEFMKKLDAIREAVGFPMIINSGFRTHDHNSSLADSVDASAHTTGWAADIALTGRSSGEITLKRALLIEAAKDHGIRRIGIGKTFLHLDSDPTKPTPRYWLYD